MFERGWETVVAAGWSAVGASLADRVTPGLERHRTTARAAEHPRILLAAVLIVASAFVAPLPAGVPGLADGPVAITSRPAPAFPDPNAHLPVDPSAAAVGIVGGARSFNDTHPSTVSNFLGGLVAPWPADRAPWHVEVFAYLVVAGSKYRKQVASLAAGLPGLAWLRIDASGRDPEALRANLAGGDAVLRRLAGNTTDSMLGNWANYFECWRAILDRERSRGWRYAAVIRARPDFMWAAKHPPLGLLAEVDPGVVFVPDPEHWGGSNDRLVVMPRALAPALLGASESFADPDTSPTLSILDGCPAQGCNPETLQLLLLRHLNATVRGFPPCAYLLESGGRDGLGIGFAEHLRPVAGGARYPDEKAAVERAMGLLEDGWEEAWGRRGRRMFGEIGIAE